MSKALFSPTTKFYADRSLVFGLILLLGRTFVNDILKCWFTKSPFPKRFIDFVLKLRDRLLFCGHYAASWNGRKSCRSTRRMSFPNRTRAGRSCQHDQKVENCAPFPSYPRLGILKLTRLSRSSQS